jgi:hypothetical protein
MRKLFILLALAAAPLVGGTVTLSQGGTVIFTLYPGAPAAAGSNFSWQFTLTNNTGFALSPTSVDSTFDPGDGIAGANPAVVDDLSDFFAAYPLGLPDGATSTQLGLAIFLIDLGATPGSQAGDPSGPCCTITLSFDLFDGGGGYDHSDSAESDFTAVVVAGSDNFVVPEPSPAMLCLMGILLLWVWRVVMRASAMPR